MKKNSDLLCKLLKEKRIRLEKTSFTNTYEKRNSFSSDELGNVTGLNLSGQALKDAAFIQGFNTLQYLNLSQNMISDISCFSELTELTRLDIHHNQIKDISSLRSLTKLKWINLGCNKITRLPSDICNWNLELKWKYEPETGVILEGNPLEKLLIQAIQGGMTNFHDYFASKEAKKTTPPPPDTPAEEIDAATDRCAGEKKRILIIAANPRGTSRIRFEEEIRKIEERRDRSKHRDQFDLITKIAARYMDLRCALLDNNPHIVHFIGHGDKDGLRFEDEEGNPATITAEVLADLFGLCSAGIECVILSACYSVCQAEAISKHIDYVIGMTEKIADAIAIEFALGFYDALASGRSVMDAFYFGGNAIRSLFPHDFKHLIPTIHKKNDLPKPLQNSSFPNTGDEKDIFLSYASEDREKYVLPLAEELKKKGISYWMDREESLCGENFAQTINSGLRKSRFVAVFLSKNFMGKEWPEKELYSTIGRKTKDNRQALIPIFIAPEKEILDYCRLLSGIHYIPWKTPLDTAEDLALSIKNHQSPAAKNIAGQKDIPNINEMTPDNQLLNWCLNSVLSDQIETGGAVGAWSKKYPDYLKLISCCDTPAGHESITFSSWIADDLSVYLDVCSDSSLARQIKRRIDLFHSYLLKHHDSTQGGFGLEFVFSPGEKKIIFDIRHTA